MKALKIAGLSLLAIYLVAVDAFIFKIAYTLLITFYKLCDIIYQVGANEDILLRLGIDPDWQSHLLWKLLVITAPVIAFAAISYAIYKIATLAIKIAKK